MPLRDDLLNPIPGDNPSGEYLYYAPIYDKIKEARREDDAGPVGEWQRERKVADWKTVIKLAGEALATKSKDLQLAVWLVEAHLKSEGFGPFKDGFTLLKGLLDNFWDTLYPELEDGDSEFRATPLQWLGNFDLQIRMSPLTRSQGYSYFQYQESRKVGYQADAEADAGKLEAFNEKIAEGKISCDDFDKAFNETPKAWYVSLVENLSGTLEAIDELQVACEERFGDYAPGWTKLRTGLEEFRQSANILLNRKREKEPDEPVAGAEPEAAEEAPAESYSYAASSEPTPAAAAPVRAVARGGPLPAEPVDPDDAKRRVVAAARYLRQQEAYSPVPYLMLMGMRFGELRAAGESIDASLLEAPPTDLRQRLKKAHTDYAWDEVIVIAEEALALPCGRAWLDVHRYTANACYQQGYYYAGLQAGIKSAVRGLLEDYPDLSSMTLLDDTPTANAETLNWLKTEVLRSGGNAAAAYTPPPAVEDSSSDAAPGVPDIWELALAAARSGRTREAIEMLMLEAAQERCGRSRFLRRTQLASICVETGNEGIAQPILEQLALEIEERQLENWEPLESVSHPLALLYRCVSKQDREGEAARKLFARLCRIDPVQALHVGS